MTFAESVEIACLACKQTRHPMAAAVLENGFEEIRLWEERLLFRSKQLGEADEAIADAGLPNKGWEELYDAAMGLKFEVEKQSWRSRLGHGQ